MRTTMSRLELGDEYDVALFLYEMSAEQESPSVPEHCKGLAAIGGLVKLLRTDLFASGTDVDPTARGKSEKLSRAMDEINHRFGRDSVLIGMTPSQGRSFSGSKIAFTRIPDTDEFLE